MKGEFIFFRSKGSSPIKWVWQSSMAFVKPAAASEKEL